jgi:methionyl-tRNA formyltransferase
LTQSRQSALDVSALRVAFAGTPDFARTALQALLALPHEVVGVFTRPDAPRGRGQRLSASAVKTTALAASLPLSQPATLADEAALKELKSWRADVLVVVAYGLILPAAMLEVPSLGSVNIHASLLPRWRGAAPIQRALLAGDATTGITVMRMAAGLDTGPILLQRSLAIGATDTSGSLHDALAKLGTSALLEALDGLARGTLDGTPQPEEGVSYAHKIVKAEARIDWQRSAAEIDRQIRAFHPWPIAETRFEEAPLRILAARIDAGEAPAHAAVLPGTVVAIGDDAVSVQCGEGCIGMTLVQRPGRRAVAAREFARSRVLLGALLG